MVPLCLLVGKIVNLQVTDFDIKVAGVPFVLIYRLMKSMYMTVEAVAATVVPLDDLSVYYISGSLFAGAPTCPKGSKRRLTSPHHQLGHR
jgi:hypothetical protein